MRKQELSEEEKARLIDDLEENYCHLSKPGDANFGRSLCEQYRKNGSLSESQWNWVEVLLSKV